MLAYETVYVGEIACTPYVFATRYSSVYLATFNHPAFVVPNSTTMFCLQLVYAFGLLSEKMEEEPKSLETFEFFLSEQTPSTLQPCLLDAVLKNVESPYADVQIHAWHTLSQITGAKTVAQALLKSKIHGRDALLEMKSCAAKSTTSRDQRRLISKTMNNMMNVSNTE